MINCRLTRLLTACKAMHMSKINHYLEFSPLIFSGGQPNEEQLSLLSHEQFKAVINLGLSDAEYSVTCEEHILVNSGIAYTHIPVEFTAPTKAKLLLFFENMQLNKEKKLLVHCAANKRAACFLGLWGEFHLDWSKTKADEYIKRVWEPDGTWSDFMGTMRQDIIANKSN